MSHPGDPQPTERADKKILRLTYQVGNHDEVVESEADCIVIGRADDADLQIRHESVSRHHCAAAIGWTWGRRASTSSSSIAPSRTRRTSSSKRANSASASTPR
ncbi:MAG: FHA domain-containing protein [Deltaproteobacteria bacterium]|nr:FHA domain-containing protein [Deltaproteobacteria bacterium]